MIHQFYFRAVQPPLSYVMRKMVQTSLLTSMATRAGRREFSINDLAVALGDSHSDLGSYDVRIYSIHIGPYSTVMCATCLRGSDRITRTSVGPNNRMPVIVIA